MFWKPMTIKHVLLQFQESSPTQDDFWLEESRRAIESRIHAEFNDWQDRNRGLLTRIELSMSQQWNQACVTKRSSRDIQSPTLFYVDAEITHMTWWYRRYNYSTVLGTERGVVGNTSGIKGVLNELAGKITAEQTCRELWSGRRWSAEIGCSSSLAKPIWYIK